MRNSQMKKDDDEDDDKLSDADSKAFSRQQKLTKDKKKNKEEKKEDRDTLELDDKDIIQYLGKERNMDCGFRLIREKAPFQW
mmetsp:Transcript_28087/g.32182  ORF Transcript_28087/g.32182 Transcript_28087/m.32182 type:complete len:82 (-) Transcript_28087:132-377(-)